LAHEVFWKKSVSKDFKKIVEERRRELFNKIEEKLSRSPTSGEKLHGKFEGLYKITIGDYRVIYEIASKGPVVLRVRHRRNAYR